MPKLDLTIQQILDIYTASYDETLKKQIVYQLEQLTFGPPSADATVAPWDSRLVSCDGFGNDKIGVIKAVRQFTTIGLKDAKDFVEGVGNFARMNVRDPERFKREVEAVGVGVKIKIHPASPAW